MNMKDSFDVNNIKKFGFNVENDYFDYRLRFSRNFHTS